MKYGMIFNNQITGLGEDILAYSVMKKIPKIDYIIDKNNLNTFIPEKNEFVKTIIYGNFENNSILLPPSPFIKPLFVSINFINRFKNKEGSFDKYFLDYLSEYLPIGLENNNMSKYLENERITNYFSGSLILTLEPFKGVKKNNKVCIEDVNRKIKKIVTEKYRDNIVESTFIIDENDYAKLSFNERMNIIEKQLKLYQSSKLVITSNIESALACLALNVPVLFIYDNEYDCEYYDDHLKLLNKCSYDDFITNPILSVENKELYKDIKNNTNKIIDGFIKQSYKDEVPNENIEDFNKYYVERKKAIDLKVSSIINEYQGIVDDYTKKYDKYYMIYRLNELEKQIKEENRIKAYNKKLRVRIMRRIRLSLPWRVLRFLKNKILNIVRGNKE